MARSPLDLLTIMRGIQRKGAGLRLLDEPFIDTVSEIMLVVGWRAHWQRRNVLVVLLPVENGR